MSDAPKLEMIMERVAPGNRAENFAMWACRGAGKGCPRNRYRKRKVHCDDCLGPLPSDMTIGDVEARIRKGDA